MTLNLILVSMPKLTIETRNAPKVCLFLPIKLFSIKKQENGKVRIVTESQTHMRL